MEQVVIKVGNSLAVTIPKNFVKKKRIKAGQKVFVEADPSFDSMQIHTKQTKSSLTPEFYEWLKKFNERYKEALTELAKK